MNEKLEFKDCNNQTLVIARNGTPVAKLVPYVQTKERPFGVLKGKHVVPDDVDLVNDEIAEMFGV